MARHSLRIFPVALFLFALILTGKLTAHSDSSALNSGQGAHRGVFDASYRSNSPTHKVVIQATETALRDSILAEGGSVVEDYGAFVLMKAPAASAYRVSVESTS